MRNLSRDANGLNNHLSKMRATKITRWKKNEMRTRHGQMGLKRTKCPPTYVEDEQTDC